MWQQLLVYVAEKWWGPENDTSMVNEKTGKKTSFHF